MLLLEATGQIQMLLFSNVVSQLVVHQSVRSSVAQGCEGSEVDVVFPAVTHQVRLSSHRQGVVVDLIDLRPDTAKCLYLLQVMDRMGRAAD